MMTGLDGFPLPPVPGDPPPDTPLQMFFFLALGFGLFLALGWFLLVQREIDREQTREQKERVAQQAVETQRETLIQRLIEQSPGGRKPWQDRREEVKPCPVTGPTKFSLNREGFGRLVRGEVIELRPDVSIALDDIGFPAMLLEITAAWKELVHEEARRAKSSH